MFVGEEEQNCREGDVESSKSQHLPDGPFVIREVNQYVFSVFRCLWITAFVPEYFIIRHIKS